MKVLNILNPVERGGGESMLMDLLTEKRVGIHEEVVLVSKCEYLTEQFDIMGINYKEIPFNIKNIPSSSKFKKLFNAFVQIIWLLANYRYLKRFDVTILHSFPIHFFSALLKNCVIVKHSVVGNKKLVNRFFAFFFRKAHKVIGVGPAVVQSLDAYYEIKSTEVWNPVASEYFDAPQLPSCEDDEEINLVHVGRLVHGKNQALSIRACSRLQEQTGKRVNLHIVGHGELETELKEIARDYSNIKVNFCGRLDKSEIINLVDKCDVGLLPSSAEGFGIAAAEYVIRSKPVVGLLESGLHNIFGNVGVFTTAETLDTAILDAIQLAKKVEFSDAVSLMKERLSVSSVKDRYIGIYEEACGPILKS
ncbi:MULTISPECIES: glycosyltransferase [Pseudoalteromonas]|uniref:Glycosyl transferase family 1 domain-containing protein n=1 Tax=Pseudoalteromonas rubra TaxID=43658 RepID=A0A0F4QDQ2_9GAMM|nr:MULTISPECIES: glycosyltransferase [Pseudoalteromonas]KJZ05826.1 hypothetical protein TW77_21485 [Pseudoalteromonas rubra]MDK1289563.1 glycosyltransferase [Pseudoalteromonas sp. B95]